MPRIQADTLPLRKIATTVININVSKSLIRHVCHVTHTLTSHNSISKMVLDFEATVWKTFCTISEAPIYWGFFLKDLKQAKVKAFANENIDRGRSRRQLKKADYNKKNLTNEASSVLEQEFSGISLDLIKNIHRNRHQNSKDPVPATPFIIVELVLVSRLQTCLLIDELKGKFEKGEINREVSIVIDGMSIRKQTVWDTKEQRFMDYGNNAVVESGEKLASEALVFMVVGATGLSWK
eukprot:gene11450-12647_t